MNALNVLQHVTTGILLNNYSILNSNSLHVSHILVSKCRFWYGTTSTQQTHCPIGGSPGWTAGLSWPRLWSPCAVEPGGNPPRRKNAVHSPDHPSETPTAPLESSHGHPSDHHAPSTLLVIVGCFFLAHLIRTFDICINKLHHNASWDEY